MQSSFTNRKVNIRISIYKTNTKTVVFGGEILMKFDLIAVQNERQPRNTATIRPETLLNDSDSERLLREGVAATVAAVFAAGTGNCF